MLQSGWLEKGFGIISGAPKYGYSDINVTCWRTIAAMHIQRFEKPRKSHF